jgi:multiple sugar transport system substrate-binding protein
MSMDPMTDWRQRGGAWKLLQYLGGRTKDGVFTQAGSLATDAMLGSGYQSAMQSEMIRTGWAKWGDVDLLLKQWDKAVGWLEVVPAVSEP